MRLQDFWYVVAESDELAREGVLARQVLDEWLVLFRGPEGRPVCLRDRCMHRAARLSRGTCSKGQLRCDYHGWTYAADGSVVAVPSEGERFKALENRKAVVYDCVEQDGYVYVRLGDDCGVEPFSMRHHGEAGWHTVRVQNRFANNVTNCVENFIDIPHTVFVHPGIFRKQRQQALDATIRREGLAVHVDYRGETDNLGWFRRFLNPDGHAIEHTDSFHAPNVTHVVYRFGPRRTFLITSQSVPVSDMETLVYTDLTYDYGLWNRLAAPIVRYQGQKVIEQDVEALSLQGEVIEKYGDRFANTPADTIHVFVESIRNALADGRDPRDLPEKSVEVSFWV